MYHAPNCVWSRYKRSKIKVQTFSIIFAFRTLNLSVKTSMHAKQYHRCMAIVSWYQHRIKQWRPRLRCDNCNVTNVFEERSRFTNCRNRPNIWQKIKCPFYICCGLHLKNKALTRCCVFIISFRSFSNAKPTAENTYHERFWLILAVFVCSSTNLCMSTGVDNL